MRRYLQTSVVMGKFTFPLTMLIAFICAWLSFFFADSAGGGELEFVPVVTGFPWWTAQLLGFVIHFLIATILIQINTTFGIIHERAAIQACLYVLLVSVYPPVQAIHSASVAAFFFSASLFMLLHTYQRYYPQGYVFHAFACLGISSLFVPLSALFLPLFWLGMFNFNALSPRSFSSSLFGFSLPYWLLFGHAFFYDRMEVFYHPLKGMIAFTAVDWTQFGLVQSVILFFVLVLFLVSAIHALTRSHKDNIRARIYLQFVILLTTVTFLLLFLQPSHCTRLLPFLFVEVSVLMGHFFAKTNSKSSNYFFIGTIVCLFLLFVFNIWMF